MKSKRKRKIKYWQYKDDIYEEWKDMVRSVGGNLYKDSNGKIHGSMRIE